MAAVNLSLLRATVVAHRGLHAHSPENSREAIVAAWNGGIPWCECDVHASADGRAVVLHDDTLERTTVGRGPVRHKPWAELKETHLIDRRGMASSSRLPGLVEIVGMMPRQSRLLVEIKPPNAEPLVREVARILRGKGCMIHSFDRANLFHARRIDPAIPLALLLEDRQLLNEALQDGWTALHVQHRMIDEGLVANLRRQGKRVGAWTVNEDHDIRRVLRAGVDMIISDVPERVQALQASLAQP
jgi:glycerophosphoryl diester phosphodiesterase